jgi:hypothetical protein
MNEVLPTLAPFTSSFEEEAADRIAAAWDDPEISQLWSETTDEGVVIGISAAGEAKLSLILKQPDVIAAFALRLLAACVEQCRDAEEIKHIRELVLTHDDHVRLREEAQMRALLAVEGERAAAVELGKRHGRAQWAQTVIDLAVAVELTGIDRQLELQRLAPMLIQAREFVRRGGAL